MATRGKPSDVYIATQSGTIELDGEPHVFVRGQTLVAAGHPMLAACPDYFEPAIDHVHYSTESATAAPGEKRGD